MLIEATVVSHLAKGEALFSMELLLFRGSFDTLDKLFHGIRDVSRSYMV